MAPSGLHTACWYASTSTQSFIGLHVILANAQPLPNPSTHDQTHIPFFLGTNLWRGYLDGFMFGEYTLVLSQFEDGDDIGLGGVQRTTLCKDTGGAVHTVWHAAPAFHIVLV